MKLNCTHCSGHRPEKVAQPVTVMSHHCLASFWRQTSKSQETQASCSGTDGFIIHLVISQDILLIALLFKVHIDINIALVYLKLCE